MKEFTNHRLHLVINTLVTVVFTGVLLTGVVSQAQAKPPMDCVPKDGRIVVAIGSSCDNIHDAMARAPGTAAEPIVIEVRPGTYVIPGGNSVIMKSYVHLRGAGREVTTLLLDPEFGGNDIFIEPDFVDNWAVTGFTFASPAGIGYGFLGHEVQNVTISDNAFVGQHQGIYLGTVADLTISGNIFNTVGDGFAASYGVLIDGGQPVRIFDNRFEGATPIISDTFGITVDFSTDTTIENNFIANNEIGMELSPAGSQAGVFTVTGNTVTGNSMYGIFVDLRVDAMIEGNKITNNGTGMWLDSKLATVTGNTITGNSIDGIESRARGGAGSPEMQANTITDNGVYGIRVQFDSDPSIIHNKITENGSADIFVTASTVTTPHISWNVYDTLAGGTYGFGQFNLKSDGTPAPAP